MKSRKDGCIILIKAQPHRSSKYSETVCCAGVGRDRKWRRQYPVPFRNLQDWQQFRRWQWIEYEYVDPTDDSRSESQKVQPESLRTLGELPKAERADFLAPLVRRSFREADALRESLTLIRPQRISLSATPKTPEELAHETREHKKLADQLSMFDKPADPLNPCRMQFRLDWIDGEGKARSHECDDWETSAAFNRFERRFGEEGAIRELKYKYEDQYLAAGLVLGFSTHKRRNVEHGTTNQWLLVGMIRLDETRQGAFEL